MKDICKYINESSVTQTKQAELIAKMLYGSELSKESYSKMLSNLDIKELKGISDNFAETDNANYIAYQPTDDEFISNSNKDSIVSKMSEYIKKHISEKK